MTSPAGILEEVLRAEQRIRSRILETPLAPSPIGPHFKLENLQHTGSFKARGAFSKLLALDPETRARGVIAASTGNHGAAVAFAARRLDVRGRIVVPETADPGKVAAIRGLGAQLEFHGQDGVVSEAYARRVAERDRIAYISPYNDPAVIGGQGTIGIELARQIPRADGVFIALGGGGLLAGVAAYLKSVWPEVRVVGCSPENSAVLIESIKTGRVLDLESKPTLSDGTAGGVEPGAITLDLCTRLADDYVTVSEEEIRLAMRLLLETHQWAVEGAAGVALAGYLRQQDRWRGKAVVVILCGGNVSESVLQAIRSAPSAPPPPGPA